MSKRLIKQSMIIMQKERLLIILKELFHIKNVLDFFLGDYPKNSTKKNHPIKNNMLFIKSDIKNIKEKVDDLNKTLNELLNEKIDNTNIVFLVTFDYTKREIEDTLVVIDSIYNKMRQMLNETMNQYIPYPSLGRRYSNNSLVMYLEHIYRKLLKSFYDPNKNIEKELILDWDYKTEFYYRQFYSPDINLKQIGKYNHYIDLPYSYYEIFYLLPSITYQIFQIILQNELNSDLIEIKQKLKEALKKDIIRKSNLVGQVYDLFGHDKYIENLVEDIISDYCSYLIHKEAYIYTFAHQTFGDGLAKDFFQRYDEDNNRFFLLPNQWKFSPKKDHNILRLWLLISFFENDFNQKQPSIQEQEKYEKIQEIKQLVSSLMNLEEDNTKTEDSFEEIYKTNYSNFIASYKATRLYLKILYTFFYDKIIKDKNDIFEDFKNKELFKNSSKEMKIFNTCWQKRFNVLNENQTTDILVPHSSCFRKELHTNNIDFIDDDFYTLRMVKIRKDVNPTPVQIEDMTKNIDFFKGEDVLNFDSYGIYDFVSLKKVSNKRNLTKEFDLYIKNISEENLKSRFFETKHILLKVDKKEDFKNIFSCTTAFVGLYIIELVKDSNKKDGFLDLKKSIEDIKNKLKNESYMIFKSLGPKDLIVLVADKKVEQIHKIAKNLLNSDYVHRTFTVILSKYNHTPDLVEEKIEKVSYLRLKKNQELKSFNKKGKVLNITGAIDKKVVWENDVKIKEINDFYNQNQEVLTDYYTKFEILEEF